MTKKLMDQESEHQSERQADDELLHDFRTRSSAAAICACNVGADDEAKVLLNIIVDVDT